MPLVAHRMGLEAGLAVWLFNVSVWEWYLPSHAVEGRNKKRGGKIGDGKWGRAGEQEEDGRGEKRGRRGRLGPNGPRAGFSVSSRPNPAWRLRGRKEDGGGIGDGGWRRAEE